MQLETVRWPLTADSDFQLTIQSRYFEERQSVGILQKDREGEEGAESYFYTLKY